MPGLVPSLAAEQALLLAYLAQQREGVRNAAYGLTDEQARRAPLDSSLSIAGLIKHLAEVEKYWINMVQQPNSATRQDQESSYEDNFRLGPNETLAEVLVRYSEVADDTDAVIGGIADLDRGVPVPKGVPWFPADVESWSVRWVLLHLIEETSRHAGHADIIRESLDGAKMHELMAAVEGWPDTEWLKAWKPAP